MSKFSKIFNLQKGEEKGVVYLLIYSFFVGAALAFYVTSATSLFLNIFERDFLPISFIAAGILVWLIGKLMNFLFKRINLSKGIPIGLFILLVSILVFLILYKLCEWMAIIFMLYAWIRVFAYMHAVVFWSLSGRLFMLQQAKRLFSLITGGEVFASIISFFSIPFLLKFIQTSDLLFISGAFLTLGFIFMFFIVSKFKDKLLTKKVSKKKQKAEDVKLFKSKYFKLIFWIAFVPIFAQFFVDFIFQAQAKVEFPHREELTAFMGVFFGVSAIIEFSLKTFISGRLLSKYGVKIGLLAFPIMLAISFSLASVFGLFFGTMGLFFSFVALGRLFTRAIRTSLNDPSIQILYQPLPSEQRVILQNKIESGPKAYASIVAGVFLWIFSQIPNISLVVFSFMLFALTVFWAKLSLDVYKEYRKQIQTFLSKTSAKAQKSFLRFFMSFFSKIFSKEKSVLSQNLGYLFFPYLKKFNHSFKNANKYKLSTLAQYANSQNTDKRKIAAKYITNYNIYKVEKLFSKLLTDDDFEVRNLAIISAGKIREKELFDKIIDNFKIENYRKSATNAILNIGQPIIKKLVKTFHSNEYNTKLQIEIVNTISLIDSNHSVDFLRSLINYPDKLIREKSINALAKVEYEPTKSEEVIISTFLEEEIRHYIYIKASLIDLGNLKEDDFLIIELKKVLSKKNDNIFDILSVLYNKKAVDLIRNNLDSSDIENSGFAIEIADTVFSEIHKELLLPIFMQLSNNELVRNYKYLYPQHKLGVFDRIIDLINADLKKTGIFVKVEAIKKLNEYDLKSIKRVLNSALVSPISLISETAAFTLFLIDQEEFKKVIDILKYKNQDLFSVYNSIKQMEGKSKLLIFEKIQLLKGLEKFAKLSNTHLYLLAKNSNEIILSENDSLFFSRFNQTDSFIVVSGQLNCENYIYDIGSIISPLYVNYPQNYLKVSEKTMILKIPLFVFNFLFTENVNFTENVFNEIVERKK